MLFPLVVAAAALVAASPTPSVAASPTVTAGASKAPPAHMCPMLLLLESTDEIHYVAAFGAETASTAAFQMTLYAQHAVYTVSLPRVVMATPVKDQRAAFRSTAIVLRNLGAEPLLAATVTAENTGTCSSEEALIRSAASLRDAARHVSAAQAELERDLADETGDGTDSVFLALSQTPAPACPVPFSDAKVVHAWEPNYPDSARKENATGTVLVLVTIGDSGAVTDASICRSSGNVALDSAARAAALSSTYTPAAFACRSRGGSYLFSAHFAAMP